MLNLEDFIQQALDLRELKKTCRKLGVSFWDYIASRLHNDLQVLSLPDLIRANAAKKIPAPT